MKVASILLAVFLCSCGNVSNKNNNPELGSAADSLNGQTEAEMKAGIADSLLNSYGPKKVEASKLSPVVVDTAYIITPNTPYLNIKIKNNSGKNVDAVRFGYSVYDNFQDNVSNSPLGYEIATSEEPLKAKKSELIMLTLTTPASKVKNTFVDRVHFTERHNLGGEVVTLCLL